MLVLISYSDKRYGFFKGKEFFTKKQVMLGMTNPYYVDRKLLIIDNFIRLSLGVPVTINSAGRLDSYNESVGGVEDSQHRIEDKNDDYILDEDFQRPVNANDISIADYQKLKSFVINNIDILYLIGLRGIGFYDHEQFVHIDVRDQNRISFWGDVSSAQKKILTKDRGILNILGITKN